MQAICLDGFDPLRHRCIVWHDAPAVLLANNRVVFQHPMREVALERSLTRRFVQRYYLGLSCSIITTTTWHEEVKQLSISDQEWLSANTVVLDVKESFLAPLP